MITPSQYTYLNYSYSALLLKIFKDVDVKDGIINFNFCSLNELVGPSSLRTYHV